MWPKQPTRAPGSNNTNDALETSNHLSNLKFPRPDNFAAQSFVCQTEIMVAFLSNPAGPHSLLFQVILQQGLEDQPIFSDSVAARIRMDILKKQFEEKKRKLEEAKGINRCALKLFSSILCSKRGKEILDEGGSGSREGGKIPRRTETFDGV